MRAIGICHEVEWLAELDQAVHQAFCALVMHVVIAGAVHDQQATLESLGLIDRRRTVVARAVRRRVQETHIALLVNRVIESLVRHGGHGHPDLIDAGVTKHRLQRARSAAAPAPDRDARGVEIVARSREGPHRVRLLPARQNADRAVHHFSPRAAARGEKWCTARSAFCRAGSKRTRCGPSRDRATISTPRASRSGAGAAADRARCRRCFVTPASIKSGCPWPPCRTSDSMTRFTRSAIWVSWTRRRTARATTVRLRSIKPRDSRVACWSCTAPAMTTCITRVQK